MRSLRSRRGLTIIELMVVVGVVAVLAALAVPSLREFVARQRVAAVNAELVTDIQFARSEAVARVIQVRVHFRENDTMTCYTVHTYRAAIGNCDCRQPLGASCPPGIPGLNEIKTVQVLKSTSVAVKPLSQFPHIIFTEPKGLTNWDDFRVAVESSISGKLRTDTNRVGRPQVCSPDGSMSGVAPCPP